MQSLEGKSLKASVLEAMKKLFESGHLLIEDVDDRAYEMLNSFPEDQGKYVIDQLRVCGRIKTKYNHSFNNILTLDRTVHREYRGLAFSYV